MTKRLVSKVKVARSLTSILLFFIIISPLKAQSVADLVLQKKLTLTFEKQRFEDVLHYIETHAKLHFVYSSNMIELNKPISFTAYERPLKEIFTSLGKQLGLEFRKQGDYVTIRKAPVAPVSISTVKEVHTAKSVLASNEQELQYIAPENIEPEKMVALSDNLSYNALMKNLLSGKPETVPDTEFLRQLLLNPTNNLHQHRHRLFASVGLFANEYSGGSEFRAGIRSLYAVVNASLVKEGYLRTGYGIGTSIPVTRKISINPVYSIAWLKSNITYNNRPFNVRARHHQIKLIGQYALTPHLTFQAGPTFNSLHAVYTLKEFEPVLEVVKVHDPNQIAGSQPSYISPTHHIVQPNTRYGSVGYLRYKTWIGFEVGFSYSINFSHRP
jgi:hypothetical protein